MQLQCPHCKARIDAPDQAVGDEFFCSFCGQPIKRGSITLIEALPHHFLTQRGDGDPPAEIGNYQVDGKAPLGTGGQGTVYRYRHKRLPRLAAIKIPRRRSGKAINDSDREQFLNEACRATELDHPNFVRVYDAGTTHDGTPYIAMELIVGIPADEFLENSHPRDIAAQLLKVAKAIDEAHNRSILHRDIKPNNILIAKDGEPKLVDFGLAINFEKTSDGKKIFSSDICGTPGFMAPEVATGQGHTRESDIYSLGATLYYLITHHHHPVTFDRRKGWKDYINRLVSEDPQLPRAIDRAIPRPLQDICLKALERDPNLRYSTANEMAEDLGRYLEGRTTLAHPSAYQTRLESRVREIIRGIEKCGDDGIIAPRDLDVLITAHRRLIESESSDASLPDWVRLQGWQVLLHLGAMILVMGPCALLFFSQIWNSFPGGQITRVCFVLTCCVASLFSGVREWDKDQVKKAIPHLVAFNLLTAITAFVILWPIFGLNVASAPIDNDIGEDVILSQTTYTNRDVFLPEWLESLGSPGTLHQLDLLVLICACSTIAASLWLRNRFRAPIFAWVFASAGMLVFLVCFLFLDWRNFDAHWRAAVFWLPSSAYMFGGFVWERSFAGRPPEHARCVRALYIVGFGVFVLSWLFYGGEGYPAAYVTSISWMRDDRMFLSYFGGGVMTLMLALLANLANTSLLRQLAIAPFVIGGAMCLFPINLLIGEHISSKPLVWELILLGNCVCLIWLSIECQRKNLLYQGSLYLAISILQIGYSHFADQWYWPWLLVVAGGCLMRLAGQYSESNGKTRSMLRRGQSWLSILDRSSGTYVLGVCAAWFGLSFVMLLLCHPAK